MEANDIQRGASHCAYIPLCLQLSLLRLGDWDVEMKYTHKWDLTLNINKTKVVVFRNGGKLRDNEKWYYSGCQLESVNEFNYLGILFFYNDKFSRTQKRAAEQGRKALFSILNVCNKNYFNIETMLSVFDTYVNTVLSYGSEVWGFHPGQDVEKIHLLFCKQITGVTKRNL